MCFDFLLLMRNGRPAETLNGLIKSADCDRYVKEGQTPRLAKADLIGVVPSRRMPCLVGRQISLFPFLLDRGCDTRRYDYCYKNSGLDCSVHEQSRLTFMW